MNHFEIIELLLGFLVLTLGSFCISGAFEILFVFCLNPVC